MPPLIFQQTLSGITPLLTDPSNQFTNIFYAILFHISRNSIHNIRRRGRIVEVGCPTATAVAPARSISMASSAVEMPPIPMIGILTACAV